MSMITNNNIMDWDSYVHCLIYLDISGRYEQINRTHSNE